MQHVGLSGSCDRRINASDHILGANRDTQAATYRLATGHNARSFVCSQDFHNCANLLVLFPFHVHVMRVMGSSKLAWLSGLLSSSQGL